MSGWADVPIIERNRLLIRAAQDIFGFRRGRTWQEFKRDKVDTQSRRFPNPEGQQSRGFLSDQLYSEELIDRIRRRSGRV